MAFFCSKTGVRIVAPGVSIAAGGSVPEFDPKVQEHTDAEQAARKHLASIPGRDDGEPSAEAKAGATLAAMNSLTKPAAKSGGK